MSWSEEDGRAIDRIANALERIANHLEQADRSPRPGINGNGERTDCPDCGKRGAVRAGLRRCKSCHEKRKATWGTCPTCDRERSVDLSVYDECYACARGESPREFSGAGNYR